MNDMNEKAGAPDKNSPVTGERLEKIFTLLSPIQFGDEKITRVKVTEPLARQQATAEREEKVHGHAFTALMLQISDMPKKAVKKLKLRDIGQIKKWLRQINQLALDEDGLSLPEPRREVQSDDPFADETCELGETPDSEFETERTFKLSVPVNYEGRTITKIKLVEPDLDAATAATKFDFETAQTSAMVAVMAGESIPVIGRMVYRDLHRMEVWMIPFVENLQTEMTG